MALSGINWPTAVLQSHMLLILSSGTGAGTPQSTVSVGPVVASSVKVPRTNHTIASGAAGSASSFPIAQLSASRSGKSAVGTQLATNVQVTRSTIARAVPTATPAYASPIRAGGYSLSSDDRLTTRIHSTRTSTVPFAPKATDLSIKMVGLPASLPPQYTPSAQSTSPSTQDDTAIIGGLVGGAIGLVVLLGLLLCCLRTRTRQPDIEASRGRRGRSNQQILDAVAKRAAVRQGRACRLNSDGMDPVALAQAQHGWQQDITADHFQQTHVRGGGTFPGPRYAAPAQAPARSRGHASRSVATKHVVPSSSQPCVSPLSSNDSYIPSYAGNRHIDVSPPGSPLYRNPRY